MLPFFRLYFYDFLPILSRLNTISRMTGAVKKASLRFGI